MPAQITDEQLRAIADIYASPVEQDMLLETINFPPGRVQRHNDSRTFWNRVRAQIRQGIVGQADQAEESLLRAAQRDWPGNTILNPPTPDQAAGARRPRNEQPTPLTHLYCFGDQAPTDLRRVASEIAQRMGIGPVDPGWTRMGRTLLLLPNASVEQARRLGDELTTRFASSGQPLETEANSYMFRDYLFERICVQGPDHGRLEFNDAPASTTAAEIAQHTMDEYRQGGAPGGEAGSRARAVVDHIQANGTTRRLDPDSNLHDNGAQEGDTFRVSPESRAAAIDPTIRAEALSRVQAQILRFAQSTPRFDVDVTPPEPSTEYLLHFSATGFGAPLSPGGTPPLLDRHSVFVVLPAQFPMQAPAAFWQPPILFHPNVDPKYGKVCIGEFEDAYTPGLDFGLVCQLLIDIARYWNYRVDSALNADAARWACSPDGIIAIEARGGKNFLKGLGWSMDAKRPLKIKRIG